MGEKLTGVGVLGNLTAECPHTCQLFDALLQVEVLEPELVLCLHCQLSHLLL